MPNYTTSYSTKGKPRFRKNAGHQLPGARRRQARRKGGQYLRHSQGFGGTRGNHGYGSNSRKSYAIIVVCCAFLLFLASIVWYANRSVDITLNGEKASVRINSNINQLIEDQDLELRAGNLLAVDDTVLEKGAGERCSVKLGKKKLSDKELETTQLKGGEELEVADGGDLYEEHDVQATDIQPTLTVNGSGAIQYVKTWGVPGRSEVWVGKVSGKTQDRGVVKEVVNCVVEGASISPNKKGEKFIALTFDDGPSSRTQEILNILAEKDVKATFFLGGDKIESNQAVVQAIAAVGHEVGSNAYNDTDLSKLSADDLRSQLTRGFDAIEQAGGGKTALLRAPGGTFSDADWAQAMDLVSAAVTWNIDSGDWLLQGSQTVVDTVVGSARNGNIVLLTDSDATADETLAALPQIIDQLREGGFTIVPLSELIAQDEDLADAISLSKVSMPKDAVLPALPQKDEGETS